MGISSMNREELMGFCIKLVSSSLPLLHLLAGVYVCTMLLSVISCLVDKEAKVARRETITIIRGISSHFT